MTKKRRRPIHLHVMASEEEQALIQERMAEAGIRNMGAVSYTHLDVYKRQGYRYQNRISRRSLRQVFG